MPGLGDLLGKITSDAVTGKAGKIVKELVGPAITQKVAEKANNLLEKAGIQKELDGKILIKLPFMKSVETNIAEVLQIHPEWNKIAAHLYDNSVKNDSTFYDLDGNVLYRINESRRNIKHVELCRNGTPIGQVQKKLILLKNPLSMAEPYRYSVCLRGRELGTIEITDRKLIRTCVKPDFDTWELNEVKHQQYVVSKNGQDIAMVHDVGENRYIFVFSDSFDPELLILVFMGIQMRDEDKMSKH